MHYPTILALDFDGVICDGMLEYFAITKRTYQQIWQEKLNLDSLAELFYQLRPVIETGWEMPVLLRALVLGIEKENILTSWSTIVAQIVREENLDKKMLSSTLDGLRDIWIEEDFISWLSLHDFYPGIIERLQEIINSPTQLYIVTTKEGRFVKKLLFDEGIDLAENLIIGKEAKRPKYETLKQLIQVNKDCRIWFVEDRLLTLESVAQQADLSTVNLYLAQWGYNTDREKELAKTNHRINLLSLEQFTQDFSVWN